MAEKLSSDEFVFFSATYWVIWEDQNHLKFQCQVTSITLKVEWLLGYIEDVRTKGGCLCFVHLQVVR